MFQIWNFILKTKISLKTRSFKCQILGGGRTVMSNLVLEDISGYYIQCMKEFTKHKCSDVQSTIKNCVKDLYYGVNFISFYK